jgi:hypothetical protein
MLTQLLLHYSTFHPLTTLRLFRVHLAVLFQAVEEYKTVDKQASRDRLDKPVQSARLNLSLEPRRT